VKLRAALLALGILHGASAKAQALQCRLPDRIDAPALPSPDGPRRVLPISGYTLALTWSPEFCRARGDRPDNVLQCGGKMGRFGFVLHGLWPESMPGTWPQWCANTPVTPQTVRSALCLTPSADLIAHEWAKHGSCMARSPGGYFRAGGALFQSLRFPDMMRLSRQPGLTAGDLRSAMVRGTPALRPAMIRIKANGRGWLEEMHLCYGREFLPAPCADRGLDDGAPLKIWRGA